MPDKIFASAEQNLQYVSDLCPSCNTLLDMSGGTALAMQLVVTELTGRRQSTADSFCGFASRQSSFCQSCGLMTRHSQS